MIGVRQRKSALTSGCAHARRLSTMPATGETPCPPALDSVVMFTPLRHRARSVVVLLTALLVLSPGSAVWASAASVDARAEPASVASAGNSASDGTGFPGVGRTGMARSMFVPPVTGPPLVLVPFRAPTTRYGPGHRGVDLRLAVGGQVLAAGAGLVTHAGPVAGRGTVTVQHPDGLRTTYEPVTATVHVGQTVTAGQPIGVLQAGHTPCAPASCLHWGAKLPDDSYLDPMGLIDGLEVRLLPWDQARG